MLVLIGGLLRSQAACVAGCFAALFLAWATPALAEDETKYSGVSDAGAASVTETHFGRLLKATGELTPKLDLGERVLKYQGDNTAVISGASGRSLFHSTIPLRAVDDDGQTREVSLDLEDHSGFVSPENPLADVRIGDILADGIRFPAIGVSIRPMGVDASTVGDVDGGRVFYPNANENADLDFVVKPTATGAETFDVLRSVDSPERLRYAVTLPAGAQLISGLDGLRIVRDGKVLLSIAPVAAFDADHKPVRGSYELTDEGFAINIAHRDQDVRYPILVDPGFVINQYYFDVNSGIYYKGWSYSQMGSWQTLNAVYQGNGYRAMQIWNPTNYWIGNGFWGKFSFITPPGAWISMANLGHYALFSNTTNACATGGLFDAAGTGWVANTATTWGHSRRCTAFGPGDQGFTAPPGVKPRELAAQWSANGDIFHTQTQLLYLGGAAVRVEDDIVPAAPSVTGLGTSGAWTKTAPTTATVNATDNGTGVQRITATKNVAGTPTTLAPVSTCDAADTTNQLSPYLWCPASTTRQIPLGTIPEGESTWTFTANDLVNLPSAASQPHIIKLDTAAPELRVSGTLYDARDGTIGPDRDYSLGITAIDGSASPLSARRSGATGVTVTLDGRPMTSSPLSTPCTRPEGSCELSLTTTLTPEEIDVLDPGAHTVRITASDAAGNDTPVQSFSFTYDPEEPISLGGEEPPTADLGYSGPASCSSLPPVAPTVVDTAASLAQTAQQALQTVQTLLPPAVRSSIQATTANLAPKLNLEGATAVSSGSLARLRVSDHLAHGFSLGAGPGGVCFHPTRVSDEALPGVLVSDSAMLFANSDQATSTVVRPTAAGAQTLTILNDASAPHSFSWRINAGAGRQLVTLDSGSLAVVNVHPQPPDDSRYAGDSQTGLVNSGLDQLEPETSVPAGVQQLAQAVGVTATELAKAHDDFAHAQNSTIDEIVLVIPKPWALDAAGQSVPASLSVTGDIVTMTVDPPPNVQFPIIADPAPSASAARRGAPMRIMTFNTRSGRPNGSDEPATDNHADHVEHSRRVAAVLDHQLNSRALSHHVPAIVGLQEMCLHDLPDVRDELNRRTQDQANVRWHADFRRTTNSGNCPDADGPRGREYGIAIIRNVRRVTGDSRRYAEQFNEPRAYMRQQIDVQGRLVEFLNTHLVPTDASGAVAARLAQSQQLLQRAASFGSPRAAAGDFNDRPSTPPIVPWLDAGFRDVDRCRDASWPNCGEPTSVFGRIDYIFTRGMGVNGADVAGVTDQTSDHDSLVASTDVE